MDTPRPSAEERLALEGGLILVPTDFSTCAKQAYDYALALAAEYGAAVRLLHVLAGYEPELYGAVEDTPDAAPLRERIEQEGRRRLSEWAERPKSAGTTVEAVTRRSLSAPRTILEEAEACGADLLVMGTHGRGRIGQFFLGSVTQRVLRAAAVPVITVRERASDTSDARPGAQGIGRVLVPTDFSEPAAQALRVACDLANRHEAALDVLHVAEPIPFPASVSLGSKSFYDYLPDLRAAVNGELTRLAEEAGCPPERLSCRAKEGRPAQVIADTAASVEADLIVMASYGRTGLERFFLGSTAERVVRRAACPVLILRASEQDAPRKAPRKESGQKPFRQGEVSSVAPPR